MYHEHVFDLQNQIQYSALIRELPSTSSVWISYKFHIWWHQKCYQPWKFYRRPSVHIKNISTKGSHQFRSYSKLRIVRFWILVYIHSNNCIFEILVILKDLMYNSVYMQVLWCLSSLQTIVIKSSYDFLLILKECVHINTNDFYFV